MHVKSQFQKKSVTSHECNRVVTSYYPIFTLLSVKWSLAVTGGLNKRKFQTFSLQSGHGCLWEVVTLKRFQIWWLALETFVFWKTGY